MKNQDFQLKLLIKQNTQMAVKLQNYRRDNQQLSRKNQSLNASVQNLSQVFSSLSAAWRTITDNQQALYTLMKKKSDNSSKALVNKYINHFKAFDQIIANLGEKITNEGHSEAATLDAKQRLASFVNNYNLFFMQFIQTYFKFNQQYLSFLNEKLQQNNLQIFTKNIIGKELQNRQKIKEFQIFVIQLKENMKIYEAHNKHTLLDGLVLHKNKEIQALKDINMKQSRKIAYMTDYSIQNTNRIIQEDIYECFCGGAKLNYFSRLWESNNKKDAKDDSKCKQQKMSEQDDPNLNNKNQKFIDLQLQNRLLLQRNVQAFNKIEKMKAQSKLADESILQSAIYMQLRVQFSQLIDYTNELTLKLNKHYDHMSELQRTRLEQIQDLKQKYERRDQFAGKSDKKDQSQQNRYFSGFKNDIELLLKDVKDYFWRMSQKSKERQQSLSKLKQNLKGIKRQNDEMNKKLSDYQQKIVKSIEHMEYRHPKYNQLEETVNELLSKENKGQENQRILKLWQQFIDYVKNRDKKIKAMQDQIRKKDKQINQKVKIEQFLKNVLAQTQLTCVQNKQKFDKLSNFQSKIQKDIAVVSQQNYKLNIFVQQQKATMQQRLKAQIQAKSKMEDKIRLISKIQQQIIITKQKQADLVVRFNQHIAFQKEKINKLTLQIKELQRQRQGLLIINAEKDKNIEKAIEEKEKKHLQLNKLRLFLKAIEQKTEYEAIKMEMQEYKSKIMCRCGAERERSIVLKTCPHIFCKKCIQDLMANRIRKCPMCSVKFTKSDIHEISW